MIWKSELSAVESGCRDFFRFDKPLSTKILNNRYLISVNGKVGAVRFRLPFFTLQISSVFRKNWFLFQ